MAAQLIESTCSYCKGSGQAESLEERWFDGTWRPNPVLSHELADAWIAQEGDMAPVRWVDCPCPVCEGEGKYLLEFTPCKIF